MTKRWILNFLFMTLGALALLLALNLAGYGPALVKHEKVRIILPPQAAARHHHGARHNKARQPRPAVVSPVVVPPVIIQPAPVLVPPSAPIPAAVPSYHEGVVCYRYQGCTHFWVDQPVQPAASVLPDCASGYIGRTCR